MKVASQLQFKVVETYMVVVVWCRVSLPGKGGLGSDRNKHVGSCHTTRTWERSQRSTDLGIGVVAKVLSSISTTIQ
jgi:hypothetical protein